MTVLLDEELLGGQPLLHLIAVIGDISPEVMVGINLLRRSTLGIARLRVLHALCTLRSGLLTKWFFRFHVYNSDIMLTYILIYVKNVFIINSNHFNVPQPYRTAPERGRKAL